MKTALISLWWLRIATFLLAGLTAASATYWVLKWMATTPPSQSATVFTPPAPADPQLVARVLGGGQTGMATKQASSAASRFKLSGVVANRAKHGYALISVDAKPAKPYRVGAHVSDDLVLQSVSPRSAALAPSLDAPVSLVLDLPVLSQLSLMAPRVPSPGARQESESDPE